MPGPNSDYFVVANPGHSIDVADTLVAGVESGSSGARVDAPNVQEAVCGVA